MAVQFSQAIRNQMLQGTIGNSSYVSGFSLLRIYSGSIPQDCASAATGTQLASMSLTGATTAFNSAANGSISKVATWNYAQATSAGTAGYFRITDSNGTTTAMQGTITLTGGGGDMTFDDITLEVGQPIVVTGFTITAGGA